MKYILSLIFALSISPIFAQDYYSFFTDRRFFDPSDLIGYQFVPGKMEVPLEGKRNLKPGQVSFGITAKNLYVKGEGINGLYNINNINSTDYGYKLLLMNARNPASQGHLKVILTKGAYVDALVFKKDLDEKEMIFLLPNQSKESRAKEKAFFTDWGEIKIDYPEDIWGKQIRPFFRITRQPRIQQRLYASDSVLVRFEHRITEIDKSKPGWKHASVVSKSETSAEEVVASEPPVAPAPKVETEDNSASPFFSSPQPKAETESNDSPFFSASSGKKPDTQKKPIDPKPPRPMEKTEELVLKEDPDAVPPIGPDEMADEKTRKSKIKIIEEYFIHLRYHVAYADGSEEIKRHSFPVRRWQEKADASARQGEEKYQIEFLGDKGKVFYLYLNTERQISSFEWNNEKLLVRD